MDRASKKRNNVSSTRLTGRIAKSGVPRSAKPSHPIRPVRIASISGGASDVAFSNLVSSARSGDALPSSRPVTRIGRRTATPRQLLISEILTNQGESTPSLVNNLDLSRPIDVPNETKPPIHKVLRRSRSESGKHPYSRPLPLETLPFANSLTKLPAIRRRKCIQECITGPQNTLEASEGASNAGVVGQSQLPRQQAELLRPTEPVRIMASAKISASGAEALRFDRSLLPVLHNTLMDMLQGLEQALNLLAIRRTTPEFCAVKPIVSSVAKRTFTVKHLSQLAAIIPEAVAILPPTTRVPLDSRKINRRSDHLVIRLDDVEESDSHCQRSQNRLEPAAARARRGLLHTRLLAHVQSCHSGFLRRESHVYEGLLWHKAFDLERHVADIPAPPLYPEAPPAEVRTICSSRPEKLAAEDDSICIQSNLPSTPRTLSAVIPKSLLDRVRAREAAQLKRDANSQAAGERLLLQRLPDTMDAVRSLLSGSRRSAIGWSSLIGAVVKSHPSNWDAEEVENQLNSLTTVASSWCEKKALPGPRGGFAFRVVNESEFAKARQNLLDRYAGKSVSD
jgi:DNA replication factor CDT1 like/DNA replication factor Cdt1 C-terminal domain